MNGGFFYSSQNSIQQWDTYNGNIYYYRGLYGLSGPDPVLGDGLLTFATQATSELGSGFPDLFRRGGGFVSDTWRVNDRLTLNLGLRYAKTSSRIADNGKPDPPGVDRYVQADDSSPVGLIGTTWHQNIDPNLKTPYMNEFRAGIERDLGGFNVGIAGLYRDRKNLLSDLLYDVNTGTYWSDVNSGYWVPFNTTVPAVGGSFPAVPITVYFQKNNAPDAFTRLTNVPDATARYMALEITANKRWNGHYLFGGSVVFSKNYGSYLQSGGNGRGQFQT